VLVSSPKSAPMPYQLKLKHVSQFKYTRTMAVHSTYVTHLGVVASTAATIASGWSPALSFSSMETFLAFEVFHGTDTETNAHKLREEIEIGLVKLNWDHQKVHSTFAKHWKGEVENRAIEDEFGRIVALAHAVTGITGRMRVEYGALIGPGPIIGTIA
jgi:hypothetical protein